MRGMDQTTKHTQGETQSESEPLHIRDIDYEGLSEEEGLPALAVDGSQSTKGLAGVLT